MKKSGIKQKLMMGFGLGAVIFLLVGLSGIYSAWSNCQAN